MTEVFEVDKGMAARNRSKMGRMVGEKFGIADALKEGASKIRNKWTKIIIGAGIGIAAVGTAAYAYMKRGKKSDKQAENTNTTQQPAENNTADKPKLDKAA